MSLVYKQLRGGNGTYNGRGLTQATRKILIDMGYSTRRDVRHAVENREISTAVPNIGKTRIREIYEWVGLQYDPASEWNKVNIEQTVQFLRDLGYQVIEPEKVIKEKSTLVAISDLPLKKGVCEKCADNDWCPMISALEQHRNMVERYGEDYYSTRPDLWDTFSIDEPEVKGDAMEWCPLYASRLIPRGD